MINISLAGNWQSFGLSAVACSSAVRELSVKRGLSANHVVVMPLTDFARIYGTTPGLSAWSPPI